MFKKLLIVITVLFTLQTSFAAVDMFLKIDGIDGESQDYDHSAEIDVLAWSWGASSNKKSACVQDLSITKYIDAASPDMLMGQAQGRHFQTATLTVRKAGQEAFEFLIITFSDVIVSSLSTGGSGGEDRLTENVTLSFSAVEYVYKNQSADGSVGDTKTASFDVRNCK